MPDWDNLITTACGDLRRLDSVIRYSSIPITIKENVATHSYYVAVYSAMIHLHTNPKDQSALGPILMYALLHDLTEGLTGDLVRTFKYSTPELKKEVDRAEEILKNKFPNEIKNLFTVCDDMAQSNISDYIKAVVKAADFLSLFQYMRREALKGNMEIIPYFDRMIDDLVKMQKSNSDVKFENGFHPAELYNSMTNAAVRIKNICFKNVDAKSLGIGAICD